MAKLRSGEDRQLTLTEEARRAQLIGVTINQISANGYPRTSLAAIAEAAGITKAAVLYHFQSKDALVDAAYQQVLTALTNDAAQAIAAAGPADGPKAYVGSMIGHLREHPQHTRMIIEALSRDDAGHEPQERWGPLAQIIDTAVEARGASGVDSRTLAIMIGGAMNAIVAERLHDPTYDTADAADQLAALIDTALR